MQVDYPRGYGAIRNPNRYYSWRQLAQLGGRSFANWAISRGTEQLRNLGARGAKTLWDYINAPKPQKSLKRSRTQNGTATLKAGGMTYGGTSAYQGRFKRGRKFKAGQQSHVTLMHTGGEITPTLYGAMSATAHAKRPIYQHVSWAQGNFILGAFTRMIIKECAKKHGYYIRSFLDVIGGDYGGTLVIEYQTSDNPVLASVNIEQPYATTETWSTFAANTRATIQSWTASDITFKSFYLRRNVNATGQQLNPTEKLYVENAHVTFVTTKKIVVQNRTGADSATDLNTNNAEHNPITGYIGVIRGQRVYPTFTDDTTVTENWAPDNDKGIVNIESGASDYSLALLDSLVRVNPGQFKPTTRCRKVILQPGAIKSTYLKYKKTMSFKDLGNWMLNIAQGVNHDALADKGYSLIFAFEKLTQTGTGTAPIVLGFDHNASFACYFKQGKRPPQNPQHIEL